MKKNPFYGISAAAMLFGCYLINHALGLEPGRLGKLLVLVGVLQLYEALLIGLGVYLISTRRAPRDGRAVLVLGTLFLLDAPLLATECATAAPRAGAGVALALMALAAGKVALVRRLLPETLSGPVAFLLGAQAILVLGLPTVVVRLAQSRLLAPVSLYSLWWITTLVLPLAHRRVLDLTRRTGAGQSGAALTAWTWIPAASVLLHLWAVGWIHQVAFHPAFLAPFLIGLALASDRERVEVQIALPAIAVLLSLGQAETLAFPLLGVAGPSVSPLRFAMLGSSVAWMILAWRYGYRHLVVFAAAAGLTGLVGASISEIVASLGAVLRFLLRLVPRDALGWGITGVVGGFVFLILGAWRSLRGEAPPPSRVPRGRMSAR